MPVPIKLSSEAQIGQPSALLKRPENIGQALASVEQALLNVKEAFGSPAENESTQISPASPRLATRQLQLLSTEEVVHITMPIPGSPGPTTPTRDKTTEVSFRIKLDSPRITRKEQSVLMKKDDEAQAVQESISVGLKLKNRPPDVVQSTLIEAPGAENEKAEDQSEPGAESEALERDTLVKLSTEEQQEQAEQVEDSIWLYTTVFIALIAIVLSFFSVMSTLQ